MIGLIRKNYKKRINESSAQSRENQLRIENAAIF